MNQFFKQVLASLIGTMTALLLATVTLGASGLLLLLLLLAQDSSPTIKDKTVLMVDLGTAIRDTEPAFTLNQAFSSSNESALTLRKTVAAIDKARQDSQITAIFLDGRQSNATKGYATLSEIREALEKFRQAGKKIIAYGMDWEEVDYYLISVADEVILNPMGGLAINGFGTQPLFYAGAFEKYGIGVQAIRVGSYKSAIEPFIRGNLSPENRQQLQTLLSQRWQNFAETVGQTRQLPMAQLQAIADNQGLLTAQKAQEKGLIDQVAYWDEVLEKLKKISAKEDQTFRQISLESYQDVAVKAVPEQRSANKIAVVYAEGEIVNGDGALQRIGGDRFSRELRKIRNDDAVKAVVLRINSPGGSATASDVILREVELIKAKKPVIISMGDVAASGGYWIATGGQHIFAEPNTITGSIGVFGLLLNTEKIGNKLGLSWDTVKTAKLADLNSSIRPKNPEELAIYQQSVNQVYNLFLDKVARSRGLTKEQVAEIAQGRVWSGEEAKQIGLVDEMGSLKDAIAYAATQANVGKDWEIAEYPAKKGWEEALLGKIFQVKAITPLKSSDPLTLEWEKFKQELTVLQAFNDPRAIYARLPLNWNFR
ncbi:MAG: signal peptide peptidase SppA [Snowella sp.]|nr:signal peptide peptidase SppA [Snowella sp.]